MQYALQGHAEIVLEGYVPPDRTHAEGPFGEWTGHYAGGVRQIPVLDIKAIYYRNDPIVVGVPPMGAGPDEMARYRAVMRSATIKQNVTNAGVPGVQAVWCHEVGGARMPPMTTRTADEEGHVTDDTLAYYLARARGGGGLITIEMASPEKAGRHRRREVGIYDDRFLPGLTRLVGEIHRAGAKASIQLGHGGGHTRIDICGETPIAPSAIPHPVYETTFETIVPEEMTKARIDATIAAHATAAVRARTAGFDCVEVHAAHGYLISQFHAPFENRRSDMYGGSLENRARFGLEVLRAVKAAVPGMPVIYRLSVEDFFPGGLPFDEGRQIAVWAAQAGADALHVTAGHYRSLPSAQVVLPPMSACPAASSVPASGVPRVKVISTV